MTRHDVKALANGCDVRERAPFNKGMRGQSCGDATRAWTTASRGMYRIALYVGMVLWLI